MNGINQAAEVLKRIKHNFKNKKLESRYLKLPSKQEYRINNSNVEIHLSDTVVCSNMQEDASAFEGWALVLKHWGKFDQVSLYWKKPHDVNNGHYQRFLFRVLNFSQYYKSWFIINNSCKALLNDLRIKIEGTYYLNSPSQNRKSEKPHHKEAILEWRFAVNNLRQPLMNLTKAKFIERQLPVGVFNEKVTNGDKYKIFTKGKSAIDLWGINDSNELMIFELKAEKNNKVGIISEIFFYICVVHWMKRGIFQHENPIDPKLQLIPKTKKIKAYFLAFDMHPLIDPRKDKTIIYELNKMIPKEIEYHYIQISQNYFITKRY